MVQNLYKFRTVDKYAIDILLRRRLFLSDWTTLNDPHEAKMLLDDGTGGLYHVNPIGMNKFNLLDDVPIARVCSLSQTWSSNLLWSHYAGGQRGMAIGITLPDDLQDITVIQVTYDDKIPEVIGPFDRAMMAKILTHKSREWRHEKETRLVSFEKDRHFVEGITITDIVFGLRTSSEDIDLVKRIAGSDNDIRFWKTCHRPGTYQLNCTDNVR